jgi:hypothetical protein
MTGGDGLLDAVYYVEAPEHEISRRFKKFQVVVKLTTAKFQHPLPVASRTT